MRFGNILTRRANAGEYNTTDQMVEDPQVLFRRYDVDGSGTISLEEFRLMLPKLGVNLCPAKSLRFFRHYDADNSGTIDYEEFLTLLFACNSNENPAGFVPGARLGPKDGFELFDTDRSGVIEEEEFYYLLQYMDIGADDLTQERMFRKYDKNRNGTIDYGEFKKVWLSLANTRNELQERGIEVPTFATKTQLIFMLDQILDEEEEMEQAAFHFAEIWRKRQSDERRRQEEIRTAEERLCLALDTLGQVYLFGGGIYNQFIDNGDEAHISHASIDSCDINRSNDLDIPSEWLELLQSLWKRRLTDRYHDLNISESTWPVWGRCPQQVALSDGTAFCLYNNNGALRTWGGTATWWDSGVTSTDFQGNDCTGRFYSQEGNITARSRALHMPGSHTIHTDESLEKSVCRYIDDDEPISNDDLKMGLEYYKRWTPAPDDQVRAHYLSLLENIEARRIKQSIELRGKPCHDASKVSMMRLLVEDIRLEKKILGDLGHRKLVEIDMEIATLSRKRKPKLVKRLSLQFAQIWRDTLCEIQKDEMQRKAEAKLEAKEHLLTKINLCLETWSSGEPTYTSVAAGSFHAGVIDASHRLYTWGTCLAGRLGTGTKSNDAVTSDDGRLSKVKGLGRGVVQASFGSSHSAAVNDVGSLYVWGSTAAGKLGLGVFDEECYIAQPRLLRITGSDCQIKRVSCGANHSACVSSGGSLYVWGCGSGGRLGLGSSNMGEQHAPRLVETLLHENVHDVSCGSFQTLAITAIQSQETSKGAIVVTGGNLYCAGPLSVLGVNAAEFSKYSCLEEREKGAAAIRIRQISAGYCHQTAITTEGELFCWGRNKNGCCGQTEDIAFISQPTVVSRLYERPKNLALNKPSRQSSVYGNHVAEGAVDGILDGRKTSYIHTLVDPQPYWEVDIQQCAAINRIKIWSCIDESEESDKDNDKHIQRLFPYWIIISKDELSSIGGLKEALDASEISVRVTKARQEFEWILPHNTQGRFIRIQKDGFDSLRYCQMEVFGFGFYDMQRVMAPVLSTAAGKDVTSAVTETVAPNTGQLTEAFNAVMAAK